MAKQKKQIKVRKKSTIRDPDVMVFPDVQETLDVQQRFKKRFIMRRYLPRLIIARKLARKRRASNAKLQIRAYNGARKKVRALISRTRGQNYSKLPYSARVSIDKQLSNKKDLVNRIRIQLLPVIRNKEAHKFSKQKAVKQSRLGKVVIRN